MPYLWLIYISMALVFTPWGEQSRMASMVTLACTVVFLPAYFGGYWVKGRQLLWIIALITLLGVVLAPFNPGAAVFFVYAAAFAPRVSGTRTAVKAIAAVVIAIIVESLVLHLTPFFLDLRADLYGGDRRSEYAFCRASSCQSKAPVGPGRGGTHGQDRRARTYRT